MNKQQDQRIAIQKHLSPCKMDLSTKVLNGLHILGDMTIIPDNKFKIIINSFYYSLLKNSDPEKDEDLKNMKPGALKQSQAAFLTLILEAVKFDTDSGTLINVLEDCKIPGDRIEYITSTYEKHKPEVEILLSSTSFSPPHIVDVNWTLQHSIKNNYTERVNQPEFLIKLKTESVGQDNTDNVQFSCTQEQLQDLVGKLKDACKSLERTAQK